MLTIKNNLLQVEVNPKGAELTHIVDLESGFDYIWNGSEWPKHSPILFPSIGRSTEEAYLLDGNVYPMQQHGFASDFDFDVIKHKSDELELRLTDNEETLKSYPFHFELIVSFQLTATDLNVKFDVKNLSDQATTFALGFHPAFNLPGDFEDFYLHLAPFDADLQQFEIVKNPFPYRSGKLVNFEHQASGFQLTRQIFEKGLVILNNQISQVQLNASKSDFTIQVEMADFPYLCLWTKEDQPLPYLCIEPFQGLPDIIDQKQELSNKEGNAKLEAQEMKTYHVKLTFGGQE